MSVDQDLRHVLRTADHCHGLVVRDGIEDACGKPPVAIIDAREVEDGCYWPACAYHAHRYGRGKCVPLADLMRSQPVTADQPCSACPFAGCACRFQNGEGR